MRRHLIGIIAVLSLLGAVACEIWPPQQTWGATLQSGSCRGGVLAAVVWLAYPEVRRMPTWLWSMLLAVLVVVAIRPRTVFVAVPIIIALAILRPRIGRQR